ncbi:MAG TPA: S8 family serine peptidase [Thermoanaerobaculia bacterium]|nr:S8 family serine peptidase [Thermoanaerobaculia bacterium]
MKRALTVVVVMLLAVSAFAAGNKDKSIKKAKKAIPNSYIVVFESRVDDTAGVADELTKKHRAKTKHVYGALKGFAAEMSAADAKAMADDPRVQYVEEDGEVSIDTTQTGATWGLDRIDQRNLPLDGNYTYTTTASNVHAYIVDTGILTSHTQFGGRASVGVDEIGDGRNGIDCNGHGTHVAGTVGGSTYGVAKGVSLVAVRVLDCSGSGSNSGVIAGVNWVASNAIKPATANMSLGGGVSQALDDAVTAAVNAGVVFCVAAGNGDPAGNPQDACTTSPARAAAAITVSATNTSDTKASWANYGTCVDIFAPGVNITSSWYSSTTATNTISGTSMATPHVCGATALYLAGNPTATPASVASAFISNATTGVVIGPGTGSPNRLLYTGFIGGAPPPPPPGGQLLGNPGFETGTAAPWVATGGVIDSSASQPAHGGSWKAWLNGYATTHTDTLYQDVTIPVTATSATLTFWLHIDSAETTTTTQFDKLQVQVRNTANSVLATLATYSNLNKAAGYSLKSFNLIAYKGQTVRIYFLGTEDSSLQTSFVIDDTALNVQ